MKKDFKELLERLNGLKKKILMMPAGVLREYYINNYYGIVTFCESIGIEINTDDIDEYADKFIDSNEFCKYEFIINVEIIESVLKNISEELLEYFHDHNFYCVNNYQNYRVNPSTLNKAMQKFLLSLSPEALKIYLQMLDESKLVMAPSNTSGGATYGLSLGEVSPVTIADDLHNLSFYNILSHEVGHVFHYYMERNNSIKRQNDIKSEVVSMLFEKLFYKFLDDEHILPEGTSYLKVCELYSIISNSAVCKLICDLIENEDIMVSIEDYTITTSLSEEEIREYLENECGHLMFFNKLWLYDIFYTIGNVISIYFYYKILEDKEKGMHELNDFIVADLTIFDIVKKYLLDISLVKRYIDETLEDNKFYKRIH